MRRFAASAAGQELLTPQQRRRINTAATLPDEFLQDVARAIEVNPEYADMARLSIEEIHETVTVANAQETLVEELEQLTRRMRDAIAVRRAGVGQRALLVYALAKRSDDEEVIAHAERMRKNLRPRGSR